MVRPCAGSAGSAHTRVPAVFAEAAGPFRDARGVALVLALARVVVAFAIVAPAVVALALVVLLLALVVALVVLSTAAAAWDLLVSLGCLEFV